MKATNNSLVLVTALVLLSAFSATAQQITGRITDESDAVIPNAVITVHNVDTGVDVRAKSTEAGVYTVPYLKPGHYTVRAAADRFKVTEQNAVELNIDQIATINFRLVVGSTSETVTVSADQPMLEFQHVSAGDVMTEERLTSLPISSENPLNVAFLSAGVFNNNGTTSVRVDQQVGGGLIANNQGVDLQIDGISVPSGSGFQNMSYEPPLEAVREFKMINANYDASFGFSQGGQLNLTTKNGTNRLHGVAYGNIQRGWLNANTWKNNNLKINRPTSKYNQYGFEVDGPIFAPHLYDGRNKSFFMASYDFNESPATSSFTQSVPDPAWLGCLNRGGVCDFSNLKTWWNNQYVPTQLYDPNSGTYVTESDGKQYIKRTPIPGNKIYYNQTNPVARAVLGYFPTPNATSTSGNTWQNNRVDVSPATRKYRNVFGRWDYNFDDKNRFFLTWGYWDNFATAASALPRSNPATNATHYSQHSRNQAYMTDFVHVVSPTLVAEFKASVAIRNDADGNGPTQGQYDPTQLGFSSSTIGLSKWMERFPLINLGGFSQLGSTSPLDRSANTLVMQPNVIWTKGAHNIRAGADLRYWQEGTRYAQGGGMTLSTGAGWTGDPDGLDVKRTYGNTAYPTGNTIASFLLGTADSGNVSAPVSMFTSRHDMGFWVQDDWKATQRLTLNLGLRWDLLDFAHDRFKQFNYGFDYSSANTTINSQMATLHRSLPSGQAIIGGLGYQGVNGNPNRPFKNLYKEWFQPRFGLSYQINAKTVFHAGISRTVSGFDVGHLAPQYGFTSNTSYVGSNDNGLTPLHNLDTPFTQLQPAPGASLGLSAGVGGDISFINPYGKAPWNWNFTVRIQRELTSRDTLEVGFVGTRMMDAGTTIDINHISPAYAAACDYARGGNRHACDDTVNQVANPFKGVAAFAGTGYYTAATLNKSMLTRPYPQFGAINEGYINIAKNSYNSLQLTEVHRMQFGLVMNGTYTYSKVIDFGAWTDYMNGIPQRVVDAQDTPHRITLSGTYQLPFGHGKTFLPGVSRWMDYAVGGWETSGSFLWQSGMPWDPSSSGVELIGNGKARTGRHTVRGSEGGLSVPAGSIRAAVPCVAYYNDSAAGALTLEPESTNYGCSLQDGAPWVVRPSYGVVHNIEYTGIRKGRTVNLNANITKKMTISEGYVLQVRMDAFNALNHPLFLQDYDKSPGSYTFGTIPRGGTQGVDQSNSPRSLQLSAKFIF